MAFFEVYGPKQSNLIATPFDKSSIMWRVQAADGYFRGAPVDELQIVYANLPKGYTQSFPKNGPVPTLQSGRIYYVYAESTDAPVAGGFFYMDGTIPVLTAVPGLCQSGLSGEVKSLKCGTHEPFVEPTDLKAMVEQNRLAEIADR